MPELFRKLKSAGLTISLDCNDDPDDGWDGGIHAALKNVDVFLPNEREIMRLMRMSTVQSALQEVARTVPLVVVKLGSEGAIARRGNEQWSSPALKVELVDPVGAGDSFDAGFLHEYIRGSDVKTCLAAGNRAGALSVTRGGGTEAFRNAEHRAKFLESHSG